MTLRADIEALRTAIQRNVATLSPLNDDAYARGVHVTANSVLADLDALLAKPSCQDGVLSIAVGTPMADIERAVIESTLAANGGDKRKTAAVLGVSPKTIYARLALYEGIRKALGAGRAVS